jgi:hypothetical protein
MYSVFAAIHVILEYKKPSFIHTICETMVPRNESFSGEK